MKIKIIITIVILVILAFVILTSLIISNPSRFFQQATVEEYPALKDDVYKKNKIARYYGYLEGNKVCFDNSATNREISIGASKESKISCLQDLKAPYYIKGNPAKKYCDGNVSKPKLFYERNYNFIGDDPRNVLIEVIDCGNSYFVYQTGPEINLEHNMGLYGPFMK